MLGEDVLEGLQQRALQHILEDENIVRCKCGNAMEFRKGKPDYTIKDDKGNVLTKKYAKHMCRYRVR